MKTIEWVFVFFLLSICLVGRSAGAATLEHSSDHSSYQARMPYEYRYGVSSPYTGDIKEHKEVTSKNGRTEGEYRWLQPNGIFRVVRYYVEGPSGFIAEVTEEDGPDITNHVSSKPREKDRNVDFGNKHSQRGSFKESRERESFGLQGFQDSGEYSGSQEFRSSTGFTGSQNSPFGFKSPQASLQSQRYQVSNGRQTFQRQKTLKRSQISQGRQGPQEYQPFREHKVSQAHHTSQKDQTSRGHQAPQEYQTSLGHQTSQRYQNSQNYQRYQVPPRHQTSKGSTVSQGYQSSDEHLVSQEYQNHQGFPRQNVSHQRYRLPTKYQSNHGYNKVAEGRQDFQGHTVSEEHQTLEAGQTPQGFNLPLRHQDIQGYQASRGFHTADGSQRKHSAPRQLNQRYFGLPTQNAISHDTNVVQMQDMYALRDNSKNKSSIIHTKPAHEKTNVLSTSSKVGLNRRNTFQDNVKTANVVSKLGFLQKALKNFQSGHQSLSKADSSGNVSPQSSHGFTLISSKTYESPHTLDGNALAQTLIRGLSKAQKQERSDYSNLRNTQGQKQSNLAHTNSQLTGFSTQQKSANLQAGLNNNIRIKSIRIIDSEPIFSQKNLKTLLPQVLQNQNHAPLLNLSGGRIGLNLNNLSKIVPSKRKHQTSSISGKDYSLNNETIESSEETKDSFVLSNSSLPAHQVDNAGVLKIEGEDPLLKSYEPEPPYF